MLMKINLTKFRKKNCYLPLGYRKWFENLMFVQFTLPAQESRGGGGGGGRGIFNVKFDPSYSILICSFLVSSFVSIIFT